MVLSLLAHCYTLMSHILTRCCSSLVHHLKDSQFVLLDNLLKVPCSFYCRILGDAAAQPFCTFGKQFQNIMKLFGDTFVNIFIECKITTGYS